MANVWAEKAAQLVMIGESETSLSDTTRQLLDRGVSSIVLYSRDFPDPESAFRLTSEIRAYAGRPVCVAIDHEGGNYTRLHKGFTELPLMATVGKTEREDLAFELGKVAGRELSAVGIDLCLGPVLDVATNPRNPVIGSRAFGSDPALVGTLGTAFARGLQSEGVAACGKHFPGHGDTVTDSNFNLPVLSHGVLRLEDVELKPFQSAVQARVAMMMVGHILFRALDPKHPASLSRPILYGLLRQKLGYRGVVLVDDIDMAALTTHFSHDQIATLGIAAGADCFLCARGPLSANPLIDALTLGIERGTVLPERVEAARRRFDGILQRHAQRTPTFDAAQLATSAARSLVSEIRTLAEARTRESSEGL